MLLLLALIPAVCAAEAVLIVRLLFELRPDWFSE